MKNEKGLIAIICSVIPAFTGSCSAKGGRSYLLRSVFLLTIFHFTF
jgi:hypothetical protein